MNEQVLIDGNFTMQRFQGKGGWTYVAVPDIPAAGKKPFNWRRVRGFIDDYEFKQYHLMSMKNGGLFLPVKSEIRKMIGKQEGDTVKIILYEDKSQLEIPADILQCLEDEPVAHKKFIALAEGYQKEFISWINSSKREETKAARIVRMITLIQQGKTLSKQ